MFNTDRYTLARPHHTEREFWPFKSEKKITSDFFFSTHHSQKESLSDFLEVKQLELQYLKPKNITTVFRELVRPQVDLPGIRKDFYELKGDLNLQRKNHSNL